MSNKSYDLEERLVNFAADTAIFCKEVPNDFVGQYYGQQLLRSSGSSALNFGEMQGAQSDKDFKNKATISLKELKESRMNLKILARIDYGIEIKRAAILEEVEQLIKIVATIIRNKT
ncbi:four helix bundle protein [Arenibacter sp. GZD96]|uniref:four helix bundle protein n=1 Tax=Aurantibrevibacter litoralis TaxID=3106030 RepID=UPI002AFEBD1B|nr:four helix bundle protein [Arenibacter sp. GZD-96]MEA1787252.1 four helix bundle protein [Arenibacter sp. GZD-96]